MAMNVKKCFGCIVSVTMIFSLLSCGGGGGGSTSGSNSSSTITVSGTFSGGNNAFHRFLNKFLPAKAYALDPGMVAKIIVFSPSATEVSSLGWGIRDYWKTWSVNLDGSFSIEIDRTSPVGMIFVGYSNQYLGYLSLSEGVNSIPSTLFNTLYAVPTKKISGSFLAGDSLTSSVAGVSGVFHSGNSTTTVIKTSSENLSLLAIGEKLYGENVVIPTSDSIGSFVVGETVTAAESGLTAIVVTVNEQNLIVKTVTGTGSWKLNEIITGSSSAATRKVKEAPYFANIVEITGPVTVSVNSLAKIDLGILSSLGGIVEPSNDPLIKELNLSEKKIKSLKMISGGFTSIARNPDKDGNGVIDFLENKMFPHSMAYTFNAGNLVGNAAVLNGLNLVYNSLTFAPPLNHQPETATMVGPAGTSYEPPINLTKALGDPTTGRYNYTAILSSRLPAGNYKFKGNSTSDLTYYIPDQSTLMSDIIVIVPSVTLNEDGTIKTVKWEYRNPDGSIPIDPTSFMSVISINLTSSVPVKDCTGMESCDPYSIRSILSTVDKLEAAVPFSMKWADISQVSIGYGESYDMSKSFTYTK